MALLRVLRSTLTGKYEIGMGNLVNIETQVTIAGWTVFSTLLHFCFV